MGRRQWLDRSASAGHKNDAATCGGLRPGPYSIRSRLACMTNVWHEDGDPWIVKGTSEVHRNGFFAVESNDVVRPDGSIGKYQVVRVCRVGVGTLAIEADGTAHMTGQWRFPIKRYSWELPMGGAEPGEKNLEAAKRELSEESGIEAADWVKLVELDLSTSITDERCVAFLASGLKHRAAHPEAREVIARVRAPFIELVERVEQGLIREAVTVAAIMSAYRLASCGRLPNPLAAAMLR
jgi:8-oxo-dGTP pyrophosphatase MutT (NUDIX family)